MWRLHTKTFPSHAAVLAATIVLAMSTALPAAASAQIVERIVATVGEQVITLSDVRAATQMALLPDVTGAPVRTVVDRLIDRELMRAEVERFGVAPPAGERMEPRIETIRRRFASAAAFTAALDASGLSDARFRAWIADDLRIEQYLQQRFDAAAQPTDEDVLQYYQSRERDFGGTPSTPPRPFQDVRDEARRRLLASRRQALVDDWIAGLRRRAEIVILVGREMA